MLVLVIPQHLSLARRGADYTTPLLTRRLARRVSRLLVDGEERVRSRRKYRSAAYLQWTGERRCRLRVSSELIASKHEANRIADGATRWHRIGNTSNPQSGPIESQRHTRLDKSFLRLVVSTRPLSLAVVGADVFPLCCRCRCRCRQRCCCASRRSCSASTTLPPQLLHGHGSMATRPACTRAARRRCTAAVGLLHCTAAEATAAARDAATA